MFDAGHVQVSRKMFAHHLWCEDRTFSRAEAWLDMVQMAAFRAGKRMVGGKLIEVPRGGIVAAVRFLSDRWKWSNTKVCLFLEMLRAENMISSEKRQGITVVFLCKYDSYNPEKRRENDGEATPGRRGNDEIEEGEEGNNARTPPRRETPTKAEVEAFEQSQLPPHDLGFAAWWHDANEGSGWVTKNGIPITKWKPAYQAARSSQRHKAEEQAARSKSYGGQQQRKLPGDNDNF